LKKSKDEMCWREQKRPQRRALSFRAMERNKKRRRRISLVSSPQHNTTLLQANTHPTLLSTRTELKTTLHFEDISKEKQIGEGSFGVVFRGKFRGEDVAVKQMKEVGASEESLDEFKKEVQMLDKFRCAFIVHFFGACLIPNHIMLVTEFACCGSLADCIRKREEAEESQDEDDA